MLGVIDQGAYGVSSAALTFIAAHTLSTSDFGRFALLYTSYVIITGLTRAITSETFAVRHSEASVAVQSRDGSSAAGLSLAVGLVITPLAAVVGGVGKWPEVMLLGAVLPLLLVQDYTRYHLITTRRLGAALTCDLVWMIVQFTMIGVLLAVDQATIESLILVWGGSAGVAAMLALRLLRLVPSLRSAKTWWQDNRTLSRTYLLEYAALAGSGYSMVYIVAVIAGIAPAGAFRGAQALFGPVTIAVSGVTVVALPEVVRRRGDGATGVHRAATFLGVSLLGMSLVAALTIVMLGPAIAPWLLGATATAALPLLLPMGIGQVMTSAMSGPLVGLRALGATSDSARLRMTNAILLIVTTASGASLGGALGAAWGFGAAQCVMAPVWYLQFSRTATSMDDTTVRNLAQALAEDIDTTVPSPSQEPAE